MDTALRPLHDRLRAEIASYGSVLVAYSGGVDSALVLKAAAEAPGSRALGVIGVSPSLAPEDLAEARATARAMGAAVRELRTDEFADQRYAANAPDRCYFCKTELYGKLAALARAEGFAVVADGFHLDDLGDVRPGQRAGSERGVRSPLRDAGFRKADVRALARALGIPAWDRPAAPCLSSRVAYGLRVTPELTARIAEAERRVRGLVPGLSDLRVRHLGTGARVEVDADRLGDAENARDRLEAALGELGYAAVAIAAYRRGSLLPVSVS